MEKRPFHLIVVTPGHTLTGDVHLSPEAILSAFLESRSPVWIPMTDVQTRSLADRRVISRSRLRLWSTAATSSRRPNWSPAPYAVAASSERDPRSLWEHVPPRCRFLNLPEGRSRAACLEVRSHIARMTGSRRDRGWVSSTPVRPRSGHNSPGFPVAHGRGQRAMARIRDLLHSRPKVDEEEIRRSVTGCGATGGPRRTARTRRPPRVRRRRTLRRTWSRATGWPRRHPAIPDRGPPKVDRPSSCRATPMSSASIARTGRSST